MSGKENLLMKDGSNALFQIFEAEDARAVMLVVHGFAEHIGRYGRLTKYFNNHGITVCVHDQRGFGEAVFDKKRMRGVAESYELFLDDIDVVYRCLESRYAGLPVVLFGHSMGGNIALSYLFSRPQSMFRLAILETPWLRLHAPLSKRVLSLSRRLGSLSPQLAVRTSPGNTYRRRHGKLLDDYHYDRLSLRLLAAISDAGEAALPKAGEVGVPTLLLSAEKEHLVSTPAIEEFYSHAGSNMQYACIEGGHHALHIDRPSVREYAFGLMLNFIEANL